MPCIEKLKSGTFRAKIYIGDVDGKKKFVSISGATKEEVAFEAAKYEAKYKGRNADLTFAAAMDKYIAERKNVLSPNTVREYTRSKKDFDDIATIPIYKIKTDDVQRHINAYSLSHSPKTVRNHHGMITSVVRYFRPDFRPNTQLPQREHKEIAIPSETEVQNILEYARVHSPDMVVPIMLGAFGPCRRGEVCALLKSDISSAGVLHISKSLAEDENHNAVTKAPKSYSGDRYIPLPQFVADEIAKVDGPMLTELSPQVITHRFWHISKNATGKIYRFHDLRHFCASFLHASGMSNSAICQRCGWSNDRVLIEIYRHAIKEQSDFENIAANEVFSKKFTF